MLLILTLLSMRVRWFHLLYQQIWLTVEVPVNESAAFLSDNDGVFKSWNYVTNVTCVNLSVFCVCNFPTASTVLWSKVKYLFYGAKTMRQHHGVREN